MIGITQHAPREDVIAELTTMLEEAKEGRLIGLVYVARFAGRGTITRDIGDLDDRDISLAIHDMTARLIASRAD